jgi:hypothetical protein
MGPVRSNFQSARNRLRGLLQTFAVTTLLAASTTFAQTAQIPVPGTSADYGKIPLSFEVNTGQADSRVKFLSRGNGYSIFISDDALILTLSRADPRHRPMQPGVPFTMAKWGDVPSTSHAAKAVSEPRQTDTLRMALAGNARVSGEIAGMDRLPGTANYFIGNDPAKWHTNIPTYSKIRYNSVYPGIDLIYHGNQRQLEYDFVVTSNADPQAIQLQFQGARKLTLNPDGELQIFAGDGAIAFHKPVIYQIINGKRETVEGNFQISANNLVSFKLGAYDRTRELVIDPTLAYSTYLGGNVAYTGDYGNSIAVDSAGNAYITGSTGSSVFPISSTAFQSSFSSNQRNSSNSYNVFVTKLNAEGTAIVYSTYLGGSGSYWYSDSGSAISVDAAGDAYVTGYTGSSNFPITSQAYDKTNKALATSDANTAFVTKLNPTGSALIYSTYLGGSGVARCCSPSVGDAATAIAVDPSGNTYIEGTTYSTDFPISTAAFQKVNNAATISMSNIFLAKLNSSGSALVASTYLGGSGYAENCCYYFSSGDFGTGLAIDGTGSAYVTGYAFSQNFPVTSDAYQKVNRADSSLNNTGASNYNAFVTKFNPTLSSLVYSTYLGGTGNPYSSDAAFGIAVDASCYAYVTGQAGSSDFPVTKGAFQTTDPSLNNTLSSFVTRLNTTGSELEYSTYLGGSITDAHERGDVAAGIRVDAAGQAYITGSAQSLNFPVTSTAYQPKNSESVYTPDDYYSGNAFIFQLKEDGSAPVYGSYLGGTGGTSGAGGDSGSALALDDDGNAYITGHTLSTNFPTLPDPGAFQTTMPANTAGNQNRGNAFVAKFSIGSGAKPGPTETTVTADSNPSSAVVPTTFTATVQQGAACGFPPTGTASFVIDGGAPIKVALNATGQASYTTAKLGVGSHTIDVSYSGDVKYEPSSGTLTETIDAAPTTIAVVSGGGQSAMYGSAFAKPLTVIVKDAKGGAAPGVLVTFTGTGLKFTPSTILTNDSGEASVSATAEATGTLTADATAADVAGTAAFTLTASKAVLTVTATSIKVPYDTTIPSLAYSISGYVNGDKPTVVTGKPTETTTATKGSPVGTYPITFGIGTLKATNYTFKLVNGTVTITSLGTVKNPTFNPVGGTYSSAQSVELADATSGATIYYTTNGTTPTTSSTKYTAAISVSSSETIKAIGVAAGYVNSAVSSATYTIK